MAENTTVISLRLNHRTDADILAHLEKVGNRTGYIKSLIRQDIEEGHLIQFLHERTKQALQEEE